ncbi:MAG: DUF4286 family protein [Flavisolibacter sp.]
MNELNKDNQDRRRGEREAAGIIYNVTTKVEPTIAETWVQWLLDEHISSVMKTKCFVDYKVVRLLDVDDSEGPTYAVQYTAESKADYNRYIELFASQISKRAFEKWSDCFISFGSVMEVVK